MPNYAEQRLLPYAPEQLFALVADVERYPEFLPWCVGARIRERQPRLIIADLIIGFSLIRERFTSHVALDPPRRIDITYTDGPFRYLNSRWIFAPAAGAGCLVDFYVDFEFKSKVLQLLIGSVFGEATRRMVGAFERRAAELYGRAAPPQPLPLPQQRVGKASR
jgi:coenzyme Q-binding protein COQ10